MIFRFLLLLSIALTSVIGCAVQQRLAPVPQTYLNGVELTARLENLPFQHSWVSPRVKPNSQNYKTVFIKPIRTDLLDKSTWQASASPAIGSQEDFEDEAQALANHFRDQFRRIGQFHEKRRYRFVSAAQSDSLVLDIALTELQFSHPVARAGALVSPIPGTGAAVSAMSDPHVSFAMRVTDAKGNLLATAADRKFAPARILDLNKLTATSSAREIVQNWSQEIADTIQLGRFAKIESRGDYSILPW